MLMTCEKCGHEWDTEKCMHCGKGVMQEKVKFLSDNIWQCTWCGWKEEYHKGNYNCPNCNYYNKPKLSGCFITTACVTSRNLPDDCEELTQIRQFRDTVMKTDFQLKPIVDEYYQTAPAIVEAINKSKQSKEIYDKIYDEMITPCLAAIAEGRNKDAVDTYYKYYLHLKSVYLS